ncbi:gamma-glutamyltranspeptidase family protein, partial [Vibrio parahaemolyticus V-223/04]
MLKPSIKVILPKTLSQ